MSLDFNKVTLNEYRNVQSYEHLPPEEIAGIVMCIDRAFGGGITEEDAEHHMSGGQILVAKRPIGSEHETIGFSSTSINIPAAEFKVPGLSTNHALYFAGAAIAKHIQGNGLYERMNALRLDYGLSHDLDLVYTRTQNPRVEEGITSSIDTLVAAGQVRGYKVGHYICRGVYGKMLTKEKPVSKHLSYDFLDYEAGDGMIITWQLEK